MDSSLSPDTSNESDSSLTSTSISGKASFYFIFLKKSFQIWLDWSVPLTIGRWMVTLLILSAYVIRVAILGGWHIVSYALGIYILNLLISFLSPQIDPEFEISPSADDSPTLPTENDQEFRPFIRRLPEFKFWYSITRACFLAILCTFFSFLNIPVFWPILLVYFIALFFVTMKKQIMHMIKYKYIPFSWGKPKYLK